MVDLKKLGAILSALDDGRVEEAKAVAHLEKRASSSAWVGSEGTTVPKPLNDTFYTFLTPDQVESYALGDIIQSREVGFGNSTGIKSAYQIIFRSENSSGHAIGALTTVVLPNDAGSNVLVAPQPEDAASINCATSYELLTGGLGDELTSYLENGYVLNIPDHQGFNSSFVAGVLEGKITLDSIRAFENAGNMTGVNDAAYAVFGYSGGSIAAGWAAELQGDYAPELNIKGYAMGGFVASPVGVIKHVNKGPAVGFVPAGLMGLASEYTELWDLLNSQLNSTSMDTLLKVLNQCTTADLLQFFGQDVFSYFSNGEDVLTMDPLQEILSNNTLGKTTPKPAMFIYQGMSDEVVPLDSVDSVVEYYCQNGADLVYNRGQGQTHVGMETSSAPLLAEYLASLFKGDFPSGCSFQGVTPSFAGNFTGDANGSVNGSVTGNTTSAAGNGTSATPTASESGSGSGSGSAGASGSHAASGSAAGSAAGSGSSSTAGSASASASGSSSGSSSGSTSGSSSPSNNAEAVAKPAILSVLALCFVIL